MLCQPFFHDFRCLPAVCIIFRYWDFFNAFSGFLLQDQFRLFPDKPEIKRPVDSFRRRHKKSKGPAFQVHIPKSLCQYFSHIPFASVAFFCGNCNNIIHIPQPVSHMDLIRISVEHGNDLSLFPLCQDPVVFCLLLIIIVQISVCIFRKTGFPQRNGLFLFLLGQIFRQILCGGILDLLCPLIGLLSVQKLLYQIFSGKIRWIIRHFRFSQAFQPHIILPVHPLDIRKFMKQEHLVDGLVKPRDLRVCFFNMDHSHILDLVIASY